MSIPIKIQLSGNIQNQLNQISNQINKDPIDSQLKVNDNQINVTPSQPGLQVNTQSLSLALTNYLNNQNYSTSLPVKIIQPKLSYDSALEIKKRLDQIKITPISLEFKDQKFIVDLSIILSLIDLQNIESTLISTNYQNQLIKITSLKIGSQEIFDTSLNLNRQKVEDFLKNIAKQIDRPTQEPHFHFDGKKVTEFQPPQIGRKLNISLSYDKLTKALLTQNQAKVQLPVDEIPPQNKLTNDLGITELIGQGVSNFAHSIENRIFNVNLGAQKLNGSLVAPGEIFSFNNTIGDITAATGFKQAYVIKSGRTILDDGGGICQVSSTLFRAVLNSGLPVIQRTAHAYRVGYYEQGFPPGLDATTYYPSVDFQFKNDTGRHILIEAHTVGLTLFVNFYGTSDGRITSLTNPIITSRIPTPPDLRQDDPTLPKGTVKQVDFPAEGATVSFRRTVTRNSEILINNEIFKSNYRPWQAIYLVGTKDG